MTAWPGGAFLGIWGVSGERFDVNYPSHGSQRQSLGGVLPRAASGRGFINSV